MSGGLSNITPSGVASSVFGGTNLGRFGLEGITSGGGGPNNPTSGATGASAAMGPGSGVLGTSDRFGGYKDNPLNPFAQVAYHWRFYANGESDKTATPVTIAETGVTGFNIKDVTMQSFMAPSSRTRNSQMTEIKMTVVEAMGVSFLDGLLQAQIASGVSGNFQKNYYFLELKFKGYTEAGAIQDPINAGMPSNGLWTWKVIIQDLDTQLNNGGAIYTLNMIVHNDIGNLATEVVRTLDPYKIEADTVGEFFSTLKDKMNASYKTHYENELVKYEFKFHAANGLPSPEQFKLKSVDSQDVDSRRNDSMSEAKREKWTGMPSTSYAIPDLVNAVISVSRDAQSLMIWGDKSKDPNTKPDGSYRVSIKYMVYPLVQWQEYDPVTGNYKKTITYHIKPYLTQQTVMSSDENAKNSQQNLQEAKKRMAKKYEYVFTGLNTEVTNFDIKFSTSWQAALPRLAGTFYWTDNVQQHARYDFKGDDEKKKFQSAGQNYQNALSATTNSTNNNVGNLLGSALGGTGLAAPVQQALSSIGNAGAIFGGSGLTGILGQQGRQNAANAFYDLFSGVGNTSGAGGLSALQGAIGAGRQGTPTRLPGTVATSASGGGEGATPAFLQASQTWMPVVGSVLSGQTGINTLTNSATTPVGAGAGSNRYVEDLLGTSSAAQQVAIVSTAQNAQGARRAAGGGMVAQRSNRGRAVYGALLDQAYDLNAMQTIDLTVRGDPYWLGGPLDAIASAESNPDQNGPNTTSGDICFLLIFRYPLGLNESGQPKFTNQETFTGLYRVQSITHTFSDGKFSQIINANRLQKVSTTDALKEDAGLSTGIGAGVSSPMTGTSPGTIGTSGLDRTSGFGLLGTPSPTNSGGAGATSPTGTITLGSAARSV